jgi:drug/metabolite transporter (DMT)-like permease
MLSQLTSYSNNHLPAGWLPLAIRQIGFSSEWKRRATILAAFAAIYLFWGSSFLAIHFAIDSIPPFLMAGSRFLLAGGFLYAWARLRGTSRPRRIHWRTAFITGGLMLLCGTGIISWAEEYVPSGTASLLVSTVPMWAVVIGAVWNRERPSIPVIAGLSLGLLGVALLIGPSHIAGGNTQTLIRMGVILVACFSWAFGTHYSRRAVRPESQSMATAMNLIAGGILLIIFSTVNGEFANFNVTDITLKSMMAFFYLAVFGSLIGFSAYMWLVKVTTPARASSNFYVNPVVAVFLGWLFAGETITNLTLLAAAVIVSAVVLIVSRKK